MASHSEEEQQCPASRSGSATHNARQDSSRHDQGLPHCDEMLRPTPFPSLDVAHPGYTVLHSLTLRTTKTSASRARNVAPASHQVTPSWSY